MAVVSDIHANLEALTAVLQAIDALRVRDVICLGDVVGYGPDPNACIRIICAKSIPCIAGNHDRVAAGLKEPTDFSEIGAKAIRWTTKRLSPESRNFLRELPLLCRVDTDTIAVHGALHPRPNDDRRIRNDIDAIQSFEAMRRDHPDARICFFGHTHGAVVWEYRDGQAHLLAGNEVGLQPDAHYLINPGSVGQSRDSDDRASFLLYDPQRRTVRFCRVAYNVAAYRGKLVRARLVRRRSRLRKIAAWVRDRLVSAYHREPLRTEPTDGVVSH